MSKTTYPIHPFAELFPYHDGESYWDIRNSIKKHGQKVPCVLWQDDRGKVWLADGRRRLNACNDLEIEPKCEFFCGTEAELLQNVLALNLHRRHLGESERAMVAAKVSKLPDGVHKNGRSVNLPTMTQPEAATALNVSVKSVRDARVVHEEGTEQERKAVEIGKASVSATARQIRARREPGDEEGSGGSHQDKPKQGAPNIDWSKFEDRIGHVIRITIDELSKTYPHLKEVKEYQTCVHAIRDFADAIDVVRTLAITSGESERSQMDAEGHVVPEGLAAVFAESIRFDQAYSHLMSAQKLIDQVAKSPAGKRLVRHLTCTQTNERVIWRMDEIERAKTHLRMTQPYSICPFCKAKKTKGCRCSEHGWITKPTWRDLSADDKARLKCN
jgi:hypothetical protein